MSCCGCHHNQHKKAAIIRYPKLGFALDGSDYYVKVENFTGNCAQLWYLECIDHGRFIITNKKNGKVLDIEGGAKSLAKLIIQDRNNGTNQQWYVNHDGTLMSSAAGKMVMDVIQSNHVIVYPIHGGENQIFQIEYQ